MSHSSDRPVHVRAPAKLNLYLAVGALRPDGYHQVVTVMQAISLADDVHLAPARTLSLVTDPHLDVPTEDNLAYRAACSLAEALGREPRVAIRITKRIPHKAGLGGASADAAAVLRGLQAMWGVSDSLTPLVREVAAALGADVPFFLGSGTALLGERGDKVLRALPTPPLDLVVVRPPVDVATAAAYAAFDDQPPEVSPGPDEMVAACESGEPGRVALALHNNLEGASVRLAPEIADALAFLTDAPGVRGAAMTGSGSAAFGVCRSPAVAREVATLAVARGWWATEASSVSVGAAVVEGA